MEVGGRGEEEERDERAKTESKSGENLQEQRLASPVQETGTSVEDWGGYVRKGHTGVRAFFREWEPAEHTLTISEGNTPLSVVL